MFPLTLYLIAGAVGYLLGSFPTGYLAGRARGVDIRQHGSGNIGATNVVRVLGKKLGAAVFMGDAFKGWLAVQATMWMVHLLARYAAQSLMLDHEFIEGVLSRSNLPMPDTQEALFQAELASRYASLSVYAGIVAALACILGHNFPVWLRFRGGKGIATTFGALLGLMPLALLVAAIIWIAVFYTWRYVSVASLLAAISLPVTITVLWHYGRADSSLIWFSCTAAALAVWQHRSNLRRLANGAEARFVPKAKPPAAV